MSIFSKLSPGFASPFCIESRNEYSTRINDEEGGKWCRVGRSGVEAEYLEGKAVRFDALYNPIASPFGRV